MKRMMAFQLQRVRKKLRFFIAIWKKTSFGIEVKTVSDLRFFYLLKLKSPKRFASRANSESSLSTIRTIYYRTLYTYLICLQHSVVIFENFIASMNKNYQFKILDNEKVKSRRHFL
jgi:hypothetical protein